MKTLDQIKPKSMIIKWDYNPDRIKAVQFNFYVRQCTAFFVEGNAFNKVRVI